MRACVGAAGGAQAMPAATARLAQLVERQPFKLVVVGSSPTVGVLLRYQSHRAGSPHCQEQTMPSSTRCTVTVGLVVQQT